MGPGLRCVSTLNTNTDEISKHAFSDCSFQHGLLAQPGCGWLAQHLPVMCGLHAMQVLRLPAPMSSRLTASW